MDDKPGYIGKVRIEVARVFLVVATFATIYFYPTNWIMGIAILSGMITLFIIVTANREPTDPRFEFPGPSIFEFLGTPVVTTPVAAVLFLAGIEMIRMFTNVFGSTSWNMWDTVFVVIVGIVVLYHYYVKLFYNPKEKIS